MTFLITCLVAVHHLGPGDGLKLVAREACPESLAGFALALFTGFPLRMLVSAERFWSILGPL